MKQELFQQNFELLKQQEVQNQSRFRFEYNQNELWPCLNDDTATTDFSVHYIYHTSWAARMLWCIRPKVHYDFSSSLYFATLVSAFIPIKYYDYRPAQISLSGLESLQADLLALPFEDNSIHSISCMHVVEHIGLGRYGDAVDYDGDKKAVKELKRILAPGGFLLFVVPVGEISIIRYNAHRIYQISQVVDLFPDYPIRNFSLILEHPQPRMLFDPDPAIIKGHYHACGCFCFQKPS